MIKNFLYKIVGIIIKNFFILLGPIYIKIGQLLSYEYPILNQLYSLQNKCPGISKYELKKIQNKYPELNISDNFIASGSIAVVHYGKINKNYQQICVKIKRPNIEKKIENSLWITRIFIYILLKIPFLKILNLKDKIYLVLELYKKQTNFIEEFNNWKIYKKTIKNTTNIIIPHFYEEYCNHEILVMNYIPGSNILDIKNISECDRIAVGRTLIGHYISSVNKGIIHGDFHCGNLAKIENNLIIYDFGIIIKLTKNEKDGFIKLLDNLVNQNIDGSIECFIEYFIESDKYIDVNQFKSLTTYFKDENLDMYSLFIKTKNIFSELNDYKIKFNNKMILLELSLLPLNNTISHLNVKKDFKYLLDNLEDDITQSILDL